MAFLTAALRASRPEGGDAAVQTEPDEEQPVPEAAPEPEEEQSSSRPPPVYPGPPAVSHSEAGQEAQRRPGRWYAVSGDEQALDLADRLARFYMKPTCWGSVGPEMLVGPEHGHWQGHFHERTFGVMGLLEYAIVRKDSQILRFVQRFYDYARCFGIARIGHFPAILRTLEAPAGQKDLDIYMAADGSAPQCSEGCATADMIWLAATLSKAGAGDYWDDVDQYVRNDLVEHQILRRDLIEAMVAAGPTHEIDPRMETGERVIPARAHDAGSSRSHGQLSFVLQQFFLARRDNETRRTGKRCCSNIRQVRVYERRGRVWTG